MALTVAKRQEEAVHRYAVLAVADVATLLETSASLVF
jgi:hypothetical protein